MKLKSALLALLLVCLLACSFAALIQKQKDLDAFSGTTALTIFMSPHSLSAFSSAFSFTGAVAEKAPIPNNSTRTAILDFVNANPGVQFRAICGNLGLSVGVVQFHLAVLHKAGLIKFIRRGKYKRFFAAGRFSKRQMETIAHLRLSTVKNILRALLEGKQVSHRELAGRLSISSQGLTWQMNRLRETGLISETRNGLNVRYSLEATCVPFVADAMAIMKV